MRIFRVLFVKLKKNGRIIGLIGASFTTAQACIWIVLLFMAVVCFYVLCAENLFNILYLHHEKGSVSPSFILPSVFHGICWFYMVLNILWLYSSIRLIIEFRSWKNQRRIRKAANCWIYMTLIVCIIDIIFFMIFTADFHRLIWFYEEQQHNGTQNKTQAKREIEITQIHNVADETMVVFKRSYENYDVENPLVKSEASYRRAATTPAPRPGWITSWAGRGFDYVRNTVNRATGTVRNVFTGRAAEHAIEDLEAGELTEIHRMQTSAPAAIMMTISIRGFIAWIVNLSLALILRNVRPGKAPRKKKKKVAS